MRATPSTSRIKAERPGGASTPDDNKKARSMALSAKSVLKSLAGDYDENLGYTGVTPAVANQLLSNYFASGGTAADLAAANEVDGGGASVVPDDLVQKYLASYYSSLPAATSPQAFQQATGTTFGLNTATAPSAFSNAPDEYGIATPNPTASLNIPDGYVPFNPATDFQTVQSMGGSVINPNNIVTINGLTYTPRSNLNIPQGGDFLSKFGPALASAAFLSAAGLGALPGASSGGLAGGASGGELAGGAGGGASLATGATTFPLAADSVTPLGLGTSGGLFDALASNPQAADLLSMGSGVSGSDLTGMALFGENPTAADLLSIGSGLSPEQVAQLGSGGLPEVAASTGGSLLDNILGAAKKVLGLGDATSTASGLFGKNGLFSSSNLDKLASLGTALSAIKYANAIPDVDTSRLESVYNDATNNETPYVNSLVDQVIGPTSQGYGNLVQGLGRRGVLGSSFANQQINNYNTDTARTLGDIASSGLQSSLSLRGNLASMINNLNLTNQQLKTGLIGRGLGAIGMGLTSPAGRK
jgi:hypothetical protein